MLRRRRRCTLAGASGVLMCVSAWAQDTPTEARAAPRASSSMESARRIAARPSTVPAGAVTLAARPAVRTAAARLSGLVRVPLSGRQELASPAPPASDEFGIALGAGRVDVTDAAAPVLEMPASGVTIVTSKRGKESIEHEELSAERKTALPWLVVEAQRTPSEPVLRTGRPFLTLAKAITWDAGAQRHIAEFLFGLDAENGALGPLGQAIDIRFSVSCEDVTPVRAQVQAIGPSGYDVVKVACSREVKNEHERQYLEIFAGQGNLRYRFQIPRRAGALGLVASQRRVLGFGFDTLLLTAGQLEEDGSPLELEEERVFQLISSGADLDVKTISIPKRASEASVEVRPSGIGSSEIVAAFGQLRSAPVPVELDWPALPVAAMLLGGALGGVGSALRVQPRHRSRRILEGSVVGLLVTLAVLVVPSLAAIPARALGTELGLFVAAAFAGFLGVPLVEWVARSLFPGVAKREATTEAEDPANVAPQ